MRKTPELKFIADNSIEYGMNIVKKLDENMNLKEALHGKEEIDEFFKLCNEIGLKTLGDLQRFGDNNKNRIIVNDLLSKYDSSMSTDAFFETLRDYKKEHSDSDEDFEYDDPLNVIKKLKRKDESMNLKEIHDKNQKLAVNARIDNKHRSL